MLSGAKNTLYDVSVPLKKLESITDPKELTQIWEELWAELHRGGKVGIASYLAIPQLIRIAKEKSLFSFNFVGICTVIEIQRHLEDNPELPSVFIEYYNKSLDELKTYVLINLQSELNKITHTTSIACLAVCDGNPKLGKAILELGNSYVLDEFLLDY